MTVGLVHYNTADEVDWTLDAIESIARAAALRSGSPGSASGSRARAC